MYDATSYLRVLPPSTTRPSDSETAGMTSISVFEECGAAVHSFGRERVRMSLYHIFFYPKDTIWYSYRH